MIRLPAFLLAVLTGLVASGCDEMRARSALLACPTAVEIGSTFEASVLYVHSGNHPTALLDSSAAEIVDERFDPHFQIAGSESLVTATFTIRAVSGPGVEVAVEGQNAAALVAWSRRCSVAFTPPGTSATPGPGSQTTEPIRPGTSASNPLPTTSTLTFRAILDADKTGTSGASHNENGTASLSMTFACGDTRCGGSFSLSSIEFPDGSRQTGAVGTFAFDGPTGVYAFSVDLPARAPCAAVHWTGDLLPTGRDSTGPTGFDVVITTSGACGLESYDIDYEGSASRS